jgi:hypothetical protein
VKGSVEGRLIDLSPFGARIEHLDVLNPGSACVCALPPSLEVPTLSARVVHSSVLVARIPRGQQLLRYQSGLAFTGLTPDRQRALASALERLASEGIP